MKYQHILKISLSVCLLICLFAGCRTTTAVDKQTVDFQFVQNIASKMAKNSYSQPDSVKNDITPSEYTQISFNPSRDLWLSDKLAYRLEFFHLGSVYNTPVAINEFKGGYTQPVRYSEELFNYGALSQKSIDKISSLDGYAGLKILYQLNQPGIYDEVISFLGNSSFRSLARNNIYGAYAYPFGVMENNKIQEAKYIQFWVGKPSPQEKTLTIYAIADCPSATGAFEYRLQPGDVTQIKVKSAIFFRKNSSAVAVSPMKTGFKCSQSSGKISNEIYSEIHDSDGLLIKNQLQTIWMPVENPEQNSVISCPTDKLSLFGLIQRDRNYDHYLNPAIPLNLTPNLWLIPDGQWMKGKVILNETAWSPDNNRNICVYWLSEQNFKTDKPYNFDYTLNWSIEEPKSEVAKVVSTKTVLNEKDKTLMVSLRFAGEMIKNLPPVTPVTPEISILGNAVNSAEPTIVKDNFNGQWRVVLFLKAKDMKEGAGPANINCTLSLDNKTISETWDYKWTP